jgi:hypothetical protein
VKPLATIHTPNGNRVELHEADGSFETVVYVPGERRALTAEEAREWYRLTRSLGGTQHGRFPG